MVAGHDKMGGMGKKVLFVALSWVVVVAGVLTLYFFRDNTRVKEITDWATSIWQILAFLGACAFAVSAWVIKHDFGQPKIPNGQSATPNVNQEQGTITLIKAENKAKVTMVDSTVKSTEPVTLVDASGEAQVDMQNVAVNSQTASDGIQPIVAEPEVSVNIDKSSMLNYGQQSKAIKYGQLSQQGQAIEVAFTVNVKNPPVNIADLQMYVGGQILKRFSHDIKGTQRTNKECYTARFQPLEPDMLKILKLMDSSIEEYHIEVKVGEHSYSSKKFPANYP